MKKGDTLKLTVNQVAWILGISVEGVHYRIKQGIINATKEKGRYIFDSKEIFGERQIAQVDDNGNCTACGNSLEAWRFIPKGTEIVDEKSKKHVIGAMLRTDYCPICGARLV